MNPLMQGKRGLVIGAPPDQPALALHQRIHRTQLSLRDSRQASSRLNTTEAFVPPNPNELDSTQASSTSSRRSRTIGTSANAGSSVSMLALSQMKPLFIIRIEYTASCTPAAPSEWPVSDFVAEMGGHLSPKTSRIASISLRSPIGVAVACGLM